MSRRHVSILLALSLSAVGGPAAGLAPFPGPEPGSEQLKVRAVHEVTPWGEGLLVEHPRRRLVFEPEGLRVIARRGAPDWSWSLAAVSSSGGRSLAEARPVAPSEIEPGTIRYDRGALLEDYRLGVDSVEQRFLLPEPLALDGEDLVIVGNVSSDGDFSPTEEGWSWSDDRGEITLGRVAVFDAEGRRLPARFDVDAGSTRITISGEALAKAPHPVLVDPEIGSNDRRVSDMGPDGDATYDAFDPAIVYNPVRDQYVVVWSGDDTSGGLVEGEYEIFGQVLSSTGTELGYSDVRISFAGGTGSSSTRAYRPAIAYNHLYDQYLVVWSADHPADGCVDNEFEIWGQILDPNLFPLFGGNFRISSNGGTGDPDFDADHPAVAYNPNRDEYLVVWQGDSDAGGLVDDELEIWAQRVYSTNLLVGSNARMSDMGGTGDPAFDALTPDVVYNPNQLQYLIVWSGDDDTGSLVDDEFEIYGQRVDETLSGVGANDVRLSDVGGVGDPAFDAYGPAVAHNAAADEYLVVWMGDDDVGGLVDNEMEIFSQRMTASLSGLGSNDFRLSDVGGIGDATLSVVWEPDVAFNPLNQQYLVVWAGEDSVDGMVNHETEVFAQALDGSIRGMGANDERISDMGGLGAMTWRATSPVVAARTYDGEFLVAWSGTDDTGSLVPGEEEIYVQRMDGEDLFCDGFESGATERWEAAH